MENNIMEKIREILRNMKDIPISKSLITDSYLSELGLDKQTYADWELNKNLDLIEKHPECIIEKYDTMNWTESTVYTLIHIADYISADYNEHDDDPYYYYYYRYYCFIYNNIIVFNESDSKISKPSIQFKYVKSQIDICDLDKIKKAFKFLSAF